MIKNPTIIRKPAVLRYAENGAFDIPTYITSVAMDYYSGDMSISEAKNKLLNGGYMFGSESDEIVINELQGALNGNERFFAYI